jgi:membrane protease YdiL (CAAX protease family)
MLTCVSKENYFYVRKKLKLRRRNSRMKSLFTAKMNRNGIFIAIIALAVGFGIITAGIPLAGSVSIMVGGLIGLYSLFGFQGVKDTFTYPKKPFSTFWFGYLGAVVFGFGMSVVVKNILHLPTAANPVTKHLSFLFLVESLPMLLGEELLTVVLLIIIANIFGGTKKAIIAGIIGSTLVFALLHLPTYQWNLLQCILVIGVARIPFTLASLRSNSIWMGYAVHVAYDWTAFLLILLLAQ